MTQIPIYALASIIAITLTLLYQKCAQKRRVTRFLRQHSCDLPRVIPSSFLGVTDLLKTLKSYRDHKFLEQVEAIFEHCGTTFQRAALGRYAVWTVEPENIKACLALQFSDFELGKVRRNSMTPLLGHGIFTTDGDEWAHYRNMIRPSFARAQAADFKMLEEHFSHLLMRIPGDGTTVDMQDLFFKLIMDTVTEFLFGHSVNSLLLDASGAHDTFSYDFAEALSWLPIRGQLRSLVHFLPEQRFRRACKNVHAYTDALVRWALESKSLSRKNHPRKDRYVYLHELVKETTDPKQLREHAMNILAAGRNTTAELLSFTFHLLSNHREVLKRLRAEVSQLNGQYPTLENIRSMKYLSYVILEVLRLYPPVPFNLRVANKDTTLPVGGGPDGLHPIMVKKGQAVVYSVWTLHRRKDLYGLDAADFKPERWESRRRGWDYLPFNGGPRICPGQNYATTEASYVIIRLLQEFEGIESRDNRPWRERLGLTLASLNGTLVGFTRKKASPDHASTQSKQV